MPKPLEQSVLKERLFYDPTTGLFTNKKSGKVYGANHSCGYVVITIDGSQYFAHRLAWLYTHGVFPPEDIDHINGIRSDNRLCNVRAVSTSENLQNKRAPQTNGSSGYLGVNRHTQTGKWNAKIHHKGKSHSLGLFTDPAEAYAAYVAAKRKLHSTNTL